jgi:hypothetical protein
MRIRDEKIWIRDKHPVSATLLKMLLLLRDVAHKCPYSKAKRIYEIQNTATVGTTNTYEYQLTNGACDGNKA